MIGLLERSTTKLRAIAGTVLALVVGASVIWYFGARERERKDLWALSAGLHNISTAQKAYYMDHSRYFTTIPDYLKGNLWNTNITIESATEKGWSATATLPGSDLTCRTGITREGTKEEWQATYTKGLVIPMECK